MVGVANAAVADELRREVHMLGVLGATVGVVAIGRSLDSGLDRVPPPVLWRRSARLARLRWLSFVSFSPSFNDSSGMVSDNMSLLRRCSEGLSK